MPRVFTDEDIRDIIGSFQHRAIATRGTIVVAVNAAWLKEYGYDAETIVGADISVLIPQEERERLLKRAATPDDQISFATPIRTVTLASDGRVVPVSVFTSTFRAAIKPHYRVMTVLVDEFSKHEVNRARDLLALSAELIGSASEEQVRHRTIGAFARSGLSGVFWRPDHPPPVGVDAATARSAITQQRPLFSGALSASPESVYLPLDYGEVLVLTGPDLDARQSYALGLFAKLLSSTMVDARAAETARQKLSNTQLLLQLARTTAGTLDLNAVMALTADSLVQLLDVSSCFILLYDEETKTLVPEAASAGRRHDLEAIHIHIADHDSIAAVVARERRVMIIPDTKNDSLAQRAPLVRLFGEAAVVAVPMITRGRLEGVVILDDTRGPREFSGEWVELATAMVAQVGLSISNARLYESLRQSYADLATTRAEMVKRERLAALGELAAIVAHEVRNPLGVIYNATSSLKRIVASASPDGNTLLEIVREECERLNQIVGDLIDFARPRQLSTQPEDVGRVLGEVVEALGNERAVRFEVVLEQNLPLLVVDRRLIRQALVNVGLNATQAVEQGGLVRLRASCDKAHDEMLIEVVDDGPGIPSEVIPRIFEPFFTTKAKGAGLGLAVVKRIIEDHGGHVSVWSTKQGTTFAFHLPLATLAAKEETASAV